MSPADSPNGTLEYSGANLSRLMQQERSYKRNSKEKPLPPARMAVPKQMEVLRAYAVAYGLHNRPVSNTEVAHVVGMHANNALAPNTFLAAVGLLTKVEGGHVPSADTIAFARAHEWDSDTAGHKLASVLEKTWFGQTVLPLVSLRPREETEVLLRLADAAEAAPEAKPQLEMTLEYLEIAGLVARENGAIRLLKPAADSGSSQGEGTSSAPAESPPPTPTIKPAANGLKDAQDQPPARSNGHVETQERPTRAMDGIKYSVTIEVSMEKMSGWSAERIAAFFAGLAQVIAAEKGTCDKMTS